MNSLNIDLKRGQEVILSGKGEVFVCMKGAGLSENAPGAGIYGRFKESGGAGWINAMHIKSLVGDATPAATRSEVKVLEVLSLCPGGNRAWVRTTVGRLKKPLKAIPQSLLDAYTKKEGTGHENDEGDRGADQGVL